MVNLNLLWHDHNAMFSLYSMDHVATAKNAVKPLLPLPTRRRLCDHSVIL